MSYVDYLKAALVHPVNLMGAGLLALAGLVTFNPLLFIVLAGFEVVWCGGAPMVPAFREHVDKSKVLKTKNEKSKGDQQVLASLPADIRDRYKRLQSVAAAIPGNFEKGTSPSAVFVQQISNRVEDLQGRYLELLKAKSRYQHQVQQNVPASIKGKLTELDAEIAAADPKLAELKTRQRGILQKRYEQAQKAEQDYMLLDAQLDTIEELVRLLSTQAVTISKPEEMTAQLDSILSEVEVTESTMDELQSSMMDLFDKELEGTSGTKQIDN